MKLILPYFILILVLLQLYLKKSTKKDDESNDKFWKRENEANSVRKKDISNLNYIVIPENLPFIQTTDSQLMNAFNMIQSLKGKKILNLTGLSNTDLKMKYGAANLTGLSEYDENFSKLARAVAKAGSILLSSGYEKEAITFLEYGISINTDVSSNYLELANYYKQHGQSDQIPKLIRCAEQLRSLMKDTIVKKLKEIANS